MHPQTITSCNHMCTSEASLCTPLSEPLSPGSPLLVDWVEYKVTCICSGKRTSLAAPWAGPLTWLPSAHSLSTAWCRTSSNSCWVVSRATCTFLYSCSQQQLCLSHLASSVCYRGRCVSSSAFCYWVSICLHKVTTSFCICITSSSFSCWAYKEPS